MDITLAAKAPAKAKNSCLCVALGSGALKGSAKALDVQCSGAIKRAMQRGDFNGKIGDSLILHEVPGIDADRILLVGAGNSAELTQTDYQKMCSALATTLLKSGATSAVVQLAADVTAKIGDTGWQIQQLAQSLVCADYQFTAHPREEKPTPSTLKKVVILTDKVSATLKESLQRGVGTGIGMSLARTLGNLAPNICTPRYLAKEAKRLAKIHSALTTKVLGNAELTKLKMHAFLAVSQGSAEPAQLICMEYRGGKSTDAPIVLVGKGVTFDTGGISIKPSAAMDEMKYDMCGAASVFGVMKTLCETKLKCNVVGVVAAAENMPDGNATRPGDVITTMSGQSIEVLNTDAEGRMVLCDTLTYVNRYKPKAVIDIATLTGACIVALGHVASAVMANNDTLRNDLYEAGQRSGDVTWPLPLWEEYQQQLDSNFADMANIGGSPAGSITAGCFLSRFAKDYDWAHLDIAGVAWHSGKNKGATGRPVPLLMQYLIDKL